MRPKFEYFLSCGIPGEMEGERYIRTPEMVLDLTFSVPMVKFMKMIDYMDESFLITDTWKKVLKRIRPVI